MPKDDLISRQAALDALTIEYNAVGILGEQWAISQCIDAIEKLPSAGHVKHGKWETKPFYGKDFEEVPNHVWCRCPFCKNKLGVFEKGNFFQFCPVCGARLDG